MNLPVEAAKVPSGLECSMCGEPFTRQSSVYQTDQHDWICGVCYNSVLAVIQLFAIGGETRSVSLIPHGSKREAEMITALVRMLALTGHKSRVRVHRHEEQMHNKDVLIHKRSSY